MNRIFICVALTGACGGGNAASPAPAAPTPATGATPATAATPAPSMLPDTTAGKTLGAWLDAFNSADEARMTTFVADYKFPQPAGWLVQFRKQTGGFDLVRVEKSDRLIYDRKQNKTTQHWTKPDVPGQEVPEAAGVRAHVEEHVLGRRGVRVQPEEPQARDDHRRDHRRWRTPDDDASASTRTSRSASPPRARSTRSRRRTGRARASSPTSRSPRRTRSTPRRSSRRSRARSRSRESDGATPPAHDRTEGALPLCRGRRAAHAAGAVRARIGDRGGSGAGRRADADRSSRARRDQAGGLRGAARPRGQHRDARRPRRPRHEAPRRSAGRPATARVCGAPQPADLRQHGRPRRRSRDPRAEGPRDRRHGSAGRARDVAADRRVVPDGVQAAARRSAVRRRTGGGAGCALRRAARCDRAAWPGSRARSGGRLARRRAGTRDRDRRARRARQDGPRGTGRDRAHRGVSRGAPPVVRSAVGSDVRRGHGARDREHGRRTAHGSSVRGARLRGPHRAARAAAVRTRDGGRARQLRDLAVRIADSTRAGRRRADRADRLEGAPRNPRDHVARHPRAASRSRRPDPDARARPASRRRHGALARERRPARHISRPDAGRARARRQSAARAAVRRSGSQAIRPRCRSRVGSRSVAGNRTRAAPPRRDRGRALAASSARAAADRGGGPPDHARATGGAGASARSRRCRGSRVRPRPRDRARLAVGRAACRARWSGTRGATPSRGS